MASLLPTGVPSHDIQNSSLAHRRSLSFRQGDGGVSSHEEMTSRSGDERSHQPNQIVVHIARVPQGRRGSLKGGGTRTGIVIGYTRATQNYEIKWVERDQY